MDTYRRCYLLETMKTMIHFKAEIIEDNQNIIMQELSNQKLKNVLILYTNPEHREIIDREYN